MRTEYEHTARLLKHLQRDLQDCPDDAAKLMQLMQLASLGRLMGGVAHTFNNILGGILGYAQLMKEELPGGSEASRQIEVIEGAAKRASCLVSQLQIYTQKHLGRRNLVDPAALVNEAVSVISSSFGRNIRIDSEMCHGRARICVDVPAICHAMITLCLNAKDAMPDGGEIRISTVTIPSTDMPPVNGDSGSMLAFRVSDHGVGISPENIKQIFQPFFSTKPPEIACGLGLSLVESIAKDHNGRVEVESQPGAGSTFSLLVPAVLPQTRAADTDTAVTADEGAGHGELIMVVDDEQDLCEMAKFILEKKGYRVLVAASGREAIQVVEERLREIQLVILDMNMPGDDGVRVYEALRRLGSTSKVILTSGYTFNSPYQQLIDSCDAPFVPKPWDLPALISETRRVLSES